MEGRGWCLCVVSRRHSRTALWLVILYRTCYLKVLWQTMRTVVLTGRARVSIKVWLFVYLGFLNVGVFVCFFFLSSFFFFFCTVRSYLLNIFSGSWFLKVIELIVCTSMCVCYDLNIFDVCCFRVPFLYIYLEKGCKFQGTQFFWFYVLIIRA